MNEPRERTYTLHGEQECDRLEVQAVIAEIAGHLSYLRVPDEGRILDAGCGSGSMTRLLATQNPGVTVVGLDLNSEYVAYARTLAEAQGLTNVIFEHGDLHALSYAAETFDLCWSKHVLFFMSHPERAIAELHRVTKTGGMIVVALEDWPSLVLDPPAPELRERWLRVASGLADIALTARLPMMMARAGLTSVDVHIEASKVYTAVGAFDPEKRWSHETELRAARPHIVNVLGSNTACDDFLADWFSYLDRADTCTVLPIWFVQGTAPARV